VGSALLTTVQVAGPLASKATEVAASAGSGLLVSVGASAVGVPTAQAARSRTNKKERSSKDLFMVGNDPFYNKQIYFLISARRFITACLMRVCTISFG
jgi:hypothetical protein